MIRVRESPSLLILAGSGAGEWQVAIRIAGIEWIGSGMLKEAFNGCVF
ncbi:MAG: hypothetical protein AAF989_00925 [Planctomycetota bacterium]